MTEPANALHDIGLSGLTAVIRTLVCPTPLNALLLKNLPLHAGRCKAILPENFAPSDLQALARYSYTMTPDKPLKDTSAHLAQYVTRYFNRFGSDSVLLIEDGASRKDEYDTTAQSTAIKDKGVIFMGDTVYFVMTHPLPDINEVQKFINNGTFVDENPAILVQWPDEAKYLNGEKVLDVSVLQTLSKTCDALYVTAFDQLSFIIWERESSFSEPLMPTLLTTEPTAVAEDRLN